MPTICNLRRAIFLSVPHRMREVMDRGGPTEREWAACERFWERRSEDGLLAILRHRDADRNATAVLFNELCEALAVAAFGKDGVSFLGDKWQAGVTQLPSSDLDLPGYDLARGDQVCGCGKKFDEHMRPTRWTDTEGRPMFHRLCSGRLVALRASPSFPRA